MSHTDNHRVYLGLDNSERSYRRAKEELEADLDLTIAKIRLAYLCICKAVDREHVEDEEMFLSEWSALNNTAEDQFNSLYQTNGVGNPFSQEQRNITLAQAYGV